MTRSALLRSFVLLCSLSAAVALPAAAEPTQAKPKVETRCGWFINPTPANAYLEDRDGSWEIGTQGGRQVEGDWPSFEEKDWLAYDERGYGYGCACMKVVANKETMEILRIVSGQGKPASQCRRDRALTEPKR